jgi:2-amino-4-hydroxy-6-hydroxymethyldihydropteridine diphosphokinase
VPVRTAYLGLGSNVGDRGSYLAGAVRAIDSSPGFEVVRASSLFESEPVGFENQPRFLNAVIEVRTALEPRLILGVTRRIEVENDRRREVRWGPRTLDIDILLVEDTVVEEPDLVVPHPRIGERRFVLEPLLELAPDLRLPDGRTVRSLLEGAVSEQGVWRKGELEA